MDEAALCRELARRTGEGQDELLGALVRLAQHGPDADTAVLVLARCLWPGLCHRAVLHGQGLGVDEACSVLVAALVEAIAGCDLERSARFVANRLLAGPTRQLQRAATHQRRAAHDEAANGYEPQAVAGIVLSGRTLLGFAVDAGVLRPADAWLMLATRIEDLPLAVAAELLGLSYEAAKKRRQRAERRWLHWWAPDLHHARYGQVRP